MRGSARSIGSCGGSCHDRLEKHRCQKTAIQETEETRTSGSDKLVEVAHCRVVDESVGNHLESASFACPMGTYSRYAESQVRDLKRMAMSRMLLARSWSMPSLCTAADLRKNERTRSAYDTKTTPMFNINVNSIASIAHHRAGHGEERYPLKPSENLEAPTSLTHWLAKSRTVAVRLVSMALTGYYKTLTRPRQHRPLSMLKYDPVVKKKVLFLEAKRGK
nr:39s ribosomal protein l33, mitochondrial [Quercus suber]